MVVAHHPAGSDFVAWSSSRDPFANPERSNAITPETVKDIQLLEHWGNGNFESITWSPDGRYFAIGTTFGVNLYDAGTFEMLQSVYIPAAHSYLLRFLQTVHSLPLQVGSGSSPFLI